MTLARELLDLIVDRLRDRGADPFYLRHILLHIIHPDLTALHH